MRVVRQGAGMEVGAAVEAAHIGWPTPLRDEIPCNATVPAVTPDAVPGVIARFDGCETAKVKVAERGQSLADDVERVAAVRDVMGEGGAVRLDANGGWSLTEAVDVLTRLAPFGLEYAEQPCADVHDLARLRVELARRGVDVPVAADESIRKAEDPLEVARLEAADVVVVKVGHNTVSVANGAYNGTPDTGVTERAARSVLSGLEE